MFERLIKAGSTLGLTGEELNNWVTAQWAEQEKEEKKKRSTCLKNGEGENWEKQQLVEKELELERLKNGEGKSHLLLHISSLNFTHENMRITQAGGR
ncbi:hypothetical protein RRG08_029664 [Elysia crispata]|uniref:Uncharacterized protein n=1 Tax=Elysia crispata TaxID=231223 RepID=A0AAE1CK19_9GAST|nr:hypothetical protein RRG08_029664 [Elysia crispata]